MFGIMRVIFPRELIPNSLSTKIMYSFTLAAIVLRVKPIAIFLSLGGL
jgi:hypothetical protein